MIAPQICHCIHYQNMSQYVTVSTTNTLDTKYVTLSNTWARKDTVTSYFRKYTLCTVEGQVVNRTLLGPMSSSFVGITYWWDHILAGSHIDGTTFCLDLILSGPFIVGFLLPVADEHVLANISPIAKIPNPRRKKSQLEKKRSYLLVFWPPVMSKVTLISPSLGRQGQLFIPNLKQKP